ncbi:MAG: glycosyltransferase family 39 protein [Chloroflexota bacterium]
MNSKVMWKIGLAILLALIFGRFIIVGMPKILFNQLSSDGDESAYLSLGLDFKEKGVMSDGTRPPLYSALLYPVAEREWSYFTSAKLITLGIGVVTLIAVYWAGVAMFSWQTALLAVFLLAANKEFHVRSTTVYADVLLAFVMAGAWYFLIKSVQGWRYCVLAGIFVGLSFLTKGSAPVLLAAWGLMALLHFRLKIFYHFELLLVPLAFIITSLPLLIYNANTFGNPTYNFATEHIFWMDRLEQINTENPEDLPTASTYFATHTIDDMTTRIDKGLRRLNPVISRSVIPSRQFEPSWVGPLLGILAVGALIYLLIFQREAVKQYLIKHQNALWFTLILYSLFYTFFTWYVAGSSAETRFVVPLLGPFYLILADIIVSLGRGVGQWINARDKGFGVQFLPRVYRLTLITIMAGAAWWLINTSRADVWALSINPYESDIQANQQPERIVQWISHDSKAQTSSDDETLVIFGPSKSLPLWKFPPHVTLKRLPSDLEDWPDLEEYLAKKSPQYVILDEDTVRRRRQALSAYFTYDEDAELINFDTFPDEWALRLIHPTLPCRWCIFSPTAYMAPNAIYAEGIELLNWQVTPDKESKTLHVSVTWRATTPLSEDFTTFVHLTAPDGFVKAQQDQQPFMGIYPTSRWQVDQLLTDQYTLTLNESVAPGEYLLLAGLYHPSTGERLAVVEGTTGPAPATILLEAIEIE